MLKDNYNYLISYPTQYIANRTYPNDIAKIQTYLKNLKQIIQNK